MRFPGLRCANPGYVIVIRRRQAGDDKFIVIVVFDMRYGLLVALHIRVRFLKFMIYTSEDNCDQLSGKRAAANTGLENEHTAHLTHDSAALFRQTAQMKKRHG